MYQTWDIMHIQVYDILICTVFLPGYSLSGVFLCQITKMALCNSNVKTI